VPQEFLSVSLGTTFMFGLLAAIPFRAWVGTTDAWQPFAEWVLRVH
jgi:hypothetical protein